jgi:hypothetical protein
MFILKSLFGSVWNDPNNKELAKIEDGQLDLVRNDQATGARECIFNNAMATIRRTSVDFHYELAITRLYEDSASVVDEDEETDDVKAFLVDEDLEFRTGSFEGEPSFIWRDPQGSRDELFEFIATGTNAPTIAFFETSILKAAYEKRHQRSSADATDAELRAFVFSPAKMPRAKKQIVHSDSEESLDEELAQHLERTRLNDGQSSPVATTSLATPGRKTALAPDKREVIETEPATFYKWDHERDAFAPVIPEEDTTVKLVKNKRHDYAILIEEKRLPYLSYDLSQDSTACWSKENRALSWTHQISEHEAEAWLVQFSDEETYQRFQQSFARCIYEIINRADWGDAASNAQTYVMDSYDVEMRDAEDVEEEAIDDALGSDESDSEEEKEAPTEEDKNPFGPSRTQEVNSQLAVGANARQSFVVRGNKIGVFNHTNNHSLEYAGTISNLEKPGGRAFAPEHMMLHDQDHSIIMQDPHDKNHLWRMDTNVGKIVDEWKVHDDIPVLHIAPDSKFAPTTAQQTFVGTSANSLFRIDPRLPGNKLVDQQMKGYATKTQFSTVATTADGYLAVGSQKGDIRLFDTIGKNAKTSLPALGDPIIGVDVSASGRWVVATCKTYLLLVDTLIGDGGNSAKPYGFQRSFPKDSKPIPRRLQLRPEHVAYMGGKVSFTPAKFNLNLTGDETSIVTSTGPYVIAWDFAKVKKGLLDKYEIKQYDDNVVADNFRFGDDKDIVVALRNNVLVVPKKKLQKPNRGTLASPARVRSSSRPTNQ